MVITYASRSLRLSQWRYCTTHREMLVVVVMCTHFRSYLQGAQFTLRQITVLSDGCRSFAMRMECWLAGTCCWASSQLLSSTVRGLSMPMRTGFLDNVDNVGDRIVWFPLLIHRWPNWMPRRFFRISHSVRNVPFHGRGFATRAVGGDLGGSHFIGGTCSRLPSGWIGF